MVHSKSMTELCFSLVIHLLSPASREREARVLLVPTQQVFKQAPFLLGGYDAVSKEDRWRYHNLKCLFAYDALRCSKAEFRGTNSSVRM